MIIATVHGRCSAGVSSAHVPASPRDFLRRRHRLRHGRCRCCYCGQKRQQTLRATTLQACDVVPELSTAFDLLNISVLHVVASFCTLLKIAETAKWIRMPKQR